jgi:hypothetical protein
MLQGSHKRSCLDFAVVVDSWSSGCHYGGLACQKSIVAALHLFCFKYTQPKKLTNCLIKIPVTQFLSDTPSS